MAITGYQLEYIWNEVQSRIGGLTYDLDLEAGRHKFLTWILAWRSWAIVAMNPRNLRQLWWCSVPFFPAFILQFFLNMFLKKFFHGVSPYCIPCVHRCPNRPPEGIWSFITGVGSYCGTSDIGSRKESSPLEEIQMLLTFESSLRTSVFFLI